MRNHSRTPESILQKVEHERHEAHLSLAIAVGTAALAGYGVLAGEVLPFIGGLVGTVSLVHHAAHELADASELLQHS